jgi:nucleoside-diphosphate kinase
MADLKEEKTLLLVKPDGVKRGIVGDILQRLEQRGLKIIGLKMVQITKEFAKKHYPGTDEHCSGMGMKTLENYQKYHKNAKKELGTDDPLKIGRMIEKWNIEYLTSGPVVAMTISGIHAIDMVRKIAGHTLPNKSDMGTIRGDYSIDSPTLANQEKRAIRNIVHASGNPIESKHEIKLWFKNQDICNYQRSDENIMF